MSDPPLPLQNATPLPPVLLADGTPVLLRPITQADEPLIVEAFRRLSPDSRYARFWQRYPELPAPMARRLADADGGRHVVWTAQDPERPDEPGLGAGSFWQSRTSPGEAEISFTIADEAQHRGVGSLLLALLWLLGESRGLHTFTGAALPDNYAVGDWFRALGATLALDHGHLTFSLPLDRGHLPATRPAIRLATIMDSLTPLLLASGHLSA